MQRGKTGFTHDAFERHAACHFHGFGGGSQGVLVLFAVLAVQFGRVGIRAEIVGVGDALFAQAVQFGTTLGDQAVFVYDGCGSV